MMITPENSAATIVDVSRAAEGANRKPGSVPSYSMGARVPEKKIETFEVDLHGERRKLPRGLSGGTNLPGTKEQPDPRKPDLIETMLDRGNSARSPSQSGR